MRIPPLPEALDSYDAWTSSMDGNNVARVSSDISPKDMWEQFISKRRPVVIDGHLTDPEWNGSRWTDLDYLKQTAGTAAVKIEPIHPSAGHFGTSAKRKQVAFAEYLDLLQQPDSAGKWYLTTQYVEEQAEDLQHKLSPQSSVESSEDEPELDTVLPTPTNALSNDFPTSPELLGSLTLQQCNLWLGNSKEGKSSGLHHDFHDNLYILLSGYKRFLLFPPSAHRYLHPRGFVDRVHPNGLIVYAPPGRLPSYLPGIRAQMPIRADGLVPSDAARWRRKARMGIKRTVDEQAAADAGEGPKDKQHRKGKAKQTRSQELAEEALQQAEIELRLCYMDEQGIDPEANTSDEEEEEEDNDDDVEEAFVSGDEGVQDLSSPGSADYDSDDTNSDGQVQRVLASLPDDMKPVAMLALQGDTKAAQTLREFMTSVSEDSSEEGDETGSLHSGDSGDGVSEPEGTADEVEDPPRPRKRNMEARATSQPDSVDDQRKSPAVTQPGKRVKIAPIADESQNASDSQIYSDSESPGLIDESGNSEAEGLPLFAGADSGSEFGDIDAGEAELERFLSASGAASDQPESEEDQDDEPQSFSRIAPNVLHEYFGVSHDPSRPKTHTSNGHARRSSSEDLVPLPGCPEPLEVFLLPGQMLYLPASWYHEVTSSSSPPHHLRGQNGVHQQSNVHMALNYWFHPPDALDFEPVQTAHSSSAGQKGDENGRTVPATGVDLGQSAIENLRSGTGTHERPYRDAEVWDEIAKAVNEQVKKARQDALAQTTDQ